MTKKADRLSAIEYITKAQAELEKGHFGTVRMLLIHAKLALYSEVQDTSEQPAPEKPGDRGTTATGVAYSVREDGSHSYDGYGGAFD